MDLSHTLRAAVDIVDISHTLGAAVDIVGILLYMNKLQ